MKKILTLLAVLAMVAGLLFLLATLFDRQQGRFPAQAGSLRDTVEYQGDTYTLRRDLQTVLVMGVDASEEQKEAGQQADLLMLLILDPNRKTLSALHIHRDTVTQIPVLGLAGEKVDTVTRQIAWAYSYGNSPAAGRYNTARAVSALLGGAGIDQRICLTMEAVQILTDGVGGVPVEVLTDLTALDDALVKGQTVKLTGQQALTYIRAHGGVTDPDRTERQRQYMQSLYRQLVLWEDPARLIDLALSLSGHMDSDLSATGLQDLLLQLKDYRFDTLHALKGTTQTVGGAIEFHPDEAALEALVVELFYEKTERSAE